ncbi:MAG TPA: VacJ family lipoprotein [Burkholderiales bacterium]|nr:VacJ family lipoprotein [Burkholderiales bacterium]
MRDSQFAHAAIALVGVLVLAGCAAPKSNPADPFERVNRAIYGFNERVDKTVLEPVAKGYRFVLPNFVRTGVGNMFSNVSEVRNVLNNTLQGKFTDAYSDVGRLTINSTLGLLGFFDIASEAGIEKHREDFGQTLGVWGVGQGPFIMLPLFGPSTVRDTAGWGVDLYTDPVRAIDPTRAQNQIRGTRLVQRRSELLDAKKIIDAAALDEYQFVRDAYLQRRRNLVYDGKPPPDKDAIGPPPNDEPAK